MNYYQLPQDVMAAVLDLNRANVTKTDAFSLAIGRIMAYQYPLDLNMSDADIKLTFLGDDYNKKVSAINSLVVIDFKKVRDYTTRWLSWRKHQACGILSAPYIREDHEHEDYFGLTKHFDKETLTLVKCENEKLCRYHVKISTLLEHISSQTNEVLVKEI